MFSERFNKDSTDLPSEPIVTPIKVHKVREAEDWEVNFFSILLTAAFAGEISVNSFSISK